MSTAPQARWRIDDVLARTRLDELLDEMTGAADRSGPGRRWHCPAPDHDDHRASVTMHTDRHGHERWRCWSGDHRGDALDLVVISRGGTRVDAIDWLASRAGMIADRPLPPPSPKHSTAPAARVMDPSVDRYARICAAVLWGPQGRPVRDWLHGRGLDDATLRANLVGCDPGRELMRRRRGLPYGKDVAATFPAFDPAGKMTFVQARYLDVDAAGRKYDNPAATLAPHPRIAFVRFDDEQQSARRLLVCEGMPDALTAAQSGFASIALLGAQTPDESVAARIAGYAENRQLDVVLMCDANAPGRHAGDRLADLLAAEAIDPIIVEPPAGLTRPDGQPIVDLNAWALVQPDWSLQLDRAISAAFPEPPPDLELTNVTRDLDQSPAIL